MIFEDLVKYITNGTIAEIDLNNCKKFKRLCFWPPNIFLILATLLKKSGTYTPIISPSQGVSLHSDHIKLVEILSTQWDGFLADDAKRYYALAFPEKENESYNDYAPLVIKELIENVFSKRHLSLELKLLTQCINKPADTTWKPYHDFLKNVYLLYSICDAACAGIELEQTNLHQYYNSLNVAKKTLSDLPAHKGSIISKQRAPQVGSGFNSTAHYLSYHDSEVSCSLYTADNRIGSIKNIKVLILPWPLEVRSGFFKPARLKKELTFTCAEEFGYFSYTNLSPPKHTDVIKVLRSAGKIDFLVFPEATMSKKEFLNLISKLHKSASKDSSLQLPEIIICGVYEHSQYNWSKNLALLTFKDTKSNEYLQIIEQSKHHRWGLDSTQINTYSIQNKLDTNKKWWEAIDINDRTLKSLLVDEKFTVSALICEDLARQEPVMDVIRAAGPNFVVALLLDGPQLVQRWSSRYASSLADDPGSSVLSVTAKGMVDRTNKVLGTNSKVVALWKDRVKGYKELELSEGNDALLLTLECIKDQEYTLDGRSDGFMAISLVYKSHHSIVVE